MGPPGNGYYVIEPTSGTELVGELPGGCLFIADTFHCETGMVSLAFTQSANTPTMGHLYGQCGSSDQCSKGPACVEPSMPGDEFSVELAVSSYANVLAPALEFYCRQNRECSLRTDSLSAVCSSSIFADMTEYGESLEALESGCNQIVLEDARGLHGVDLGCSATDGSKCSGVLYRYKDGRNKKAVCPSGSELILQVSGMIGNIEYLLTPQGEGIDMLGDELPSGCVFVGGSYRCEPGQVQFRFSHSRLPCDVTETEEGCGQPVSGSLYGRCGEALDCLEDISSDDVVFEVIESSLVCPVKMQTPAPSVAANPASDRAATNSTATDPTATPTFTPTESPSTIPSTLKLISSSPDQNKQHNLLLLVMTVNLFLFW